MGASKRYSSEEKVGRSAGLSGGLYTAVQDHGQDHASTDHAPSSSRSQLRAAAWLCPSARRCVHCAPSCLRPLLLCFGSEVREASDIVASRRACHSSSANSSLNADLQDVHAVALHWAPLKVRQTVSCWSRCPSRSAWAMTCRAITRCDHQPTACKSNQSTPSSQISYLGERRARYNARLVAPACRYRNQHRSSCVPSLPCTTLCHLRMYLSPSLFRKTAMWVRSHEVLLASAPDFVAMPATPS